eukprot:jgi/Mesvir1/17233/Mv07646-RA.1
MFYGASVWDPLLIIAQIVCLQCLHYLSLGVLLFLFIGSRVPALTTTYIFDWHTVNVSTFTGWCIILSCMCNALVGAAFLCILVERAKKCLDFTATLYILHLLFCTLHTGLPTGFEWWLVHILGLATMAVIGEWLCLRRELREIPIRTGGRSVGPSSMRSAQF